MKIFLIALFLFISISLNAQSIAYQGYYFNEGLTIRGQELFYDARNKEFFYAHFNPILKYKRFTFGVIFHNGEYQSMLNVDMDGLNGTETYNSKENRTSNF